MAAEFRFKQFTVRQDHSAMKVGTDAILLGAWASAAAPLRILDIGSGTGLISLMIAQRFPAAMVDAVEIDQKAFWQSSSNFINSPWQDRLSAHHQCISSFSVSRMPEPLYSMIVSNPPWFQNSLRSGDAARDMARHTDTLSSEVLLSAATRLLSSDGQFSVVVPTETAPEFEAHASHAGLYLQRRCVVHPKPTLPAKRSLLAFGHEEPRFPIETSALIVENDQRHDYTDEYRTLTKEFYLRF